MDKRSKVYFRLFLMRFRKNYQYFLSHYNGKNLNLYREQFTHDNMKLAQVLFGDEGVKKFKNYVKEMGC